MGQLRTTITLHSGDAEQSVEVRITYTVQRGFRATHTQPGEADSVTLDRMTILDGDQRHNADWLLPLIAEDEEIRGLCLLDWRDDQIEAEEARAEYRAEELREIREGY